MPFFIILFILLLGNTQSSAMSNDLPDPDWRKLKKEYDEVDKNLVLLDSPENLSRRSPYGPGDYKRNLPVGRMIRYYDLHVPPSYDRSRPMPLVINLHGGGGRAASARLQTGMDKKADKEGFIVVYPNGTGKLKDRFLVWNAGACCDPAKAENVDDVGFISALIGDVGSYFKIDLKRVYATGLSNGAMMSYRLACELTDKIAAIAPVVAVMNMDQCNPKRPISIIHFHGTGDKNAPYEGGRGEFNKTGTYFKSVKENAEDWIAKNKCVKKPMKEINSKNAKIEIFQCAEGAEVEIVTIEGMGHAWPSGKQMLRGVVEGRNRDAVNANDMIWDFFQRHPMK